MDQPHGCVTQPTIQIGIAEPHGPLAVGDIPAPLRHTGVLPQLSDALPRQRWINRMAVLLSQPFRSESPNPTGPWQWVTYLRRFGTQAYFLNFPTRFLANDGSTAWLCYSANHSDRNRRTPRAPGSG